MTAQYEANLEAKFEKQRRELEEMRTSATSYHNPQFRSLLPPSHMQAPYDSLSQHAGHAWSTAGGSLMDPHREQEAQRKLMELRQKHQQTVLRNEQYEAQRLARLESNRQNTAQQYMQRNHQMPMSLSQMVTYRGGHYRPQGVPVQQQNHIQQEQMSSFRHSPNERPQQQHQNYGVEERGTITSHQQQSAPAQSCQGGYGFDPRDSRQLSGHGQTGFGQRPPPPSMIGESRRSFDVSEPFGASFGATTSQHQYDIDISGLNGITSGLSRTSLSSVLGRRGENYLGEGESFPHDWDSFTDPTREG
jgi:hypothetical protein